MRTFSVPVWPLDSTELLARRFNGQTDSKLNDFPVFRRVLTVKFHR